MGAETLRSTCRKVSGALHAIYDSVIPQSEQLANQLSSQEKFAKAGGAFVMGGLEAELIADLGRDSVRRRACADTTYPYWYRDTVQFEIGLVEVDSGQEAWFGKGVSMRANYLGGVNVDVTYNGKWQSFRKFYQNLLAQGYDGKPLDELSLLEKVGIAKEFAQPLPVFVYSELEKLPYR